MYTNARFLITIGDTPARLTSSACSLVVRVANYCNRLGLKMMSCNPGILALPSIGKPASFSLPCEVSVSWLFVEVKKTERLSVCQ